MQDLNDLAYFAAVADHGGFAAAGRALGLPKSKLSRRVAALETRLGVRLLQRSTRRFAVTELGDAYLRHCRAILAEAEAAEAVIAEQTDTPRGTVRLSCPPALLHHAVNDMVVNFLNAWPHVRVHVQVTNRNVDVWQDGVDFALRVRPPSAAAALPADEVVRPLAISPHLLVGAPALLTTVPPLSTPDDLAALPQLGLGNSPEEAAWLLTGPGGDAVTVPLRPRLVADDTVALLSAAERGVGCAILPSLVAHDALESGALVPLLPGWKPQDGVVQAAFASRRGMRPAVRRLLDFLAESFDGLVAEGRCLAATSSQRTQG